MNKIEQLHLDGIETNISSESNYAKILGKQEAASKSADITEDIAVEFAEWVIKHLVNNIETGNYMSNEPKTTKELFQEFIKTKQ